MKKIELAKILAKLSEEVTIYPHIVVKDKVKFLMTYNTKTDLENKIKKIIK